MFRAACPNFRSGEEGFYPELIEFTEERLKKVNPKRWDNLHGDNSNDDDVMMMMMMMMKWMMITMLVLAKTMATVINFVKVILNWSLVIKMIKWTCLDTAISIFISYQQKSSQRKPHQDIPRFICIRRTGNNRWSAGLLYIHAFFTHGIFVSTDHEVKTLKVSFSLTLFLIQDNFVKKIKLFANLANFQTVCRNGWQVSTKLTNHWRRKVRLVL